MGVNPWWFTLNNLNKDINRIGMLLEAYKFELLLQNPTKVSQPFELHNNVIDHYGREKIIEAIVNYNITVFISGVELLPAEAEYIFNQFKDKKLTSNEIIEELDIFRYQRVVEDVQSSKIYNIKLTNSLIAKYGLENILEFVSEKGHQLKINNVNVSTAEARHIIQTFKDMFKEKFEEKFDTINAATIQEEIEAFKFKQLMQEPPSYSNEVVINKNIINKCSIDEIINLLKSHVNINPVTILSEELSNKDAVLVLERLKENKENIADYNIKKQLKAIATEKILHNFEGEQITRIEITNEMLDKYGVEAVINFISSNKQLTYVDLLVSDEKNLALLINEASHLQNLQVLLVGFDLKDHSAEALARLIQNTKSLQSLNIRDTEMSEENGQKVISAICKNETIKDLDITMFAENKESTLISRSITRIAKENHTIESITAKHTKLTSKELFEAMAENKSIKKLNFYDSYLSGILYDSVEKMFETNFSLVEFTCKNQSLECRQALQRNQSLVKEKASVTPDGVVGNATSVSVLNKKEEIKS